MNSIELNYKLIKTKLETNWKLIISELRINYESWMNIYMNELHLSYEICMRQLIKHGSRWINFIIHNLISEKKFKTFIQILEKKNSFDMRKGEIFR